MKNLIAACIAGLFILSAFGTSAQQSDVKTIKNGPQDIKAFTHTVFAEDATATWCGYCHFAREALDKIYTSGDYPFYYTCMVDDKNTHAAARNLEYNIYGFPTVFFDGGYKVAVGGGTGNEAQYRSYISQCGAATVKDIDITLNVDWLGDAAMDISASVLNNEATQYNGRIRVYVTEVESSMNWKDTAGHPYTFPFLDYAFNEVISIAPSNTWTDSITWDGHNYNDGHGHDFGTIQYGNIMVIAVVYNSEVHQGYAYPPNQYPFNAYYVDDATGVLVGQTGPDVPSNPVPTEGATGISVSQDVSWTGGPGSSTTYDVYFGTVSNPPSVSTGQSSTTYDPGTMNANTTYYWKIVAWDQGVSAEGPVWHFTTGTNTNRPPEIPTVTGPATGKPGTVSTDPESDQVYYFIDWGDNTTTDWNGPHNSGADVTLTHTWSTKSTYVVKVKAKDSKGAESDWGTLTVKIPTIFVPHFTLRELLQKLAIWFPLLERFIQ